MRISTIRPVHVESFPQKLEDGVLYISKKFSTACHRCCCGCGTKIVTPLRTTEYRFTEIGGRISVYPSIGNWNHPCQSHYLIRNGRVIRAGFMEQVEIDEGRALDEAEKRAYFARPSQPHQIGFWDWLKSLFR